MVHLDDKPTPINSSNSYNHIVQCWKAIPTNYSEQNLELNLVQPLLTSLNLAIHQIKAGVSLGIGTGLTPDRLIYPQDTSKPPTLVLEIKKRVSALANASDANFVSLCQKHPLYRSAVGYKNNPSENGIKQYLDSSHSKIAPNKLASYGLVFNGDFFQLWRRVDGLILPLTPIQRVTEQSIPQLMKQLEYCLHNPSRALVTAIWNRKGGVAKTTNTLNLASVLALKGKKVLLIDLDTQNDLTRTLGLDPNKYDGYLNSCIDKLHAAHFDEAKSILLDNIQTRQFLTSEKNKISLDILPGNQKSLEKFRDRKDIDPPTRIKLLNALIHCVVEKYDYIFIDTSPASDVLTRTTLLCCDTVLIPTDYSKKTLHHAVDLHNRDIPIVRQQRSQRETLHIGPWNLGLVFSNCPSGVTPQSQLGQCIQNELTSKSFTGKKYKTQLQIYAQTKLAEYKSVPVICWENSPITKLYKELADEVFLNHNFVDC